MLASCYHLDQILYAAIPVTIDVSVPMPPVCVPMPVTVPVPAILRYENLKAYLYDIFDSLARPRICLNKSSSKARSRHCSTSTWRRHTESFSFNRFNNFWHSMCFPSACA